MDSSTSPVPATLSQESCLLLTLEEISQLISHCHNPQETLESIVRLIQGRFGTDVSSAYLFEPETAELVLAASIGLDPSSVGRVRMKLGEGLTGLVAQRMEPIMEADAPRHPGFKYFPESGEDPYHSFLGVPLIGGGMLQGVLVVQTTDQRRFCPNEIRMLVAVGAQLAPLVSGACLIKRVAAAGSRREAVRRELPLTGSTVWRGSPLAPGVGIGQAYIIEHRGPLERPEQPAQSIAVESRRLAEAMEAARDEVTRISRRISSLVGEDHGAILQAQLMFLQDSTVERDLAAALAAGLSAERAVIQTLETYVAAFEKLANPYFRERVFDIKDVFRRVLWHLRPDANSRAPVEERLVLATREASVLDLFSVDLDQLVGVVVEQGGPQGHASIVARSLGIPMVGQVVGLLEQIGQGQVLRVDGDQGVIDLKPSPANLASSARGMNSVRRASRGRKSASSQDQRVGGLPQVEANINLLGEIAGVLESGADGVGLYRSEMLFLARRTLPTEEEQVGIYRKLVESLGGRPVTIRTFDLRPDKLGYGSTIASSLGGALDWRNALTSPMLQRLFKEQVRAILRTAALGPVRLLIPMVTRTRLLDLALDTLRQSREELAREQLEFDPSVPLGVMIEVAAVAPLVPRWSPRVDFFAIGTNDLLATSLGIGRDDPRGLLGEDLWHPGLVQIIANVVRGAHSRGKKVTICGEMAGDPVGAVILAALGADSLSLAVDRVAEIRRWLSGMASDRFVSLQTKLSDPETLDEAIAELQVWARR